VIVDSSAMVAIIRGEPGSERLEEVIFASDSVGMSSGSYLETGIVIDARSNPTASWLLDRLLADFDVEIHAFTAEQALIARQAYRDYGRGSGHPARLNFGDCMSYALAKVHDEELLFKGNDFTHTDVRAALA